MTTPQSDAELVVAGTLLHMEEEGIWPETLPHELELVVKHAPLGFTDYRNGRLVMMLRELRSKGEPTHPIAIKKAMLDTPEGMEPLFGQLEAGYPPWIELVRSGRSIIEKADQEAKLLNENRRHSEFVRTGSELAVVASERPDQLKVCIRFAGETYQKLLDESKNGQLDHIPTAGLDDALTYVEPEGCHLLLPKYVSRGDFTSIIGQPGVGKSRLAFNLAICQIIGRPWCGLQTSGKPLKWLYLGPENSMGRIATDLTRMVSGLSPEQKELVRANLRYQNASSYEGGIVNLEDPKVVDRIRRTLDTDAPDAILMDPMDSFSLADLSKPEGMAETLDMIERLVHAYRHDCFAILFHHARVGRVNIAASSGNFDAMGYALGGKTIISRSRTVLNVMPDCDDDSRRIVLACAKANNCEKFADRGLVLDPETFFYEKNETWDRDEWIARVSGKNKKTSEGFEVIIELVRSGVTESHQLIESVMSALEVKRTAATDKISAAVKKGYLSSPRRGVYSFGHKRFYNNDL